MRKTLILYNYFKLSSEEDPRILEWLNKKNTHIYMSSDIQNEMLKVMSLQFIREIAGTHIVLSFTQ